MATKTIVTCDLCGQEIVPGQRIVRFSASRWSDMHGYGSPHDGDYVPLAKFDMSEFCGDGCVLAAVRGLLNGAA